MSELCNKCLNTGRFWNGEEYEECECGYNENPGIDGIIDLEDDLDSNGLPFDDEDAYD